MDISKIKITTPQWKGSKFANSKITYKGVPLTMNLVGTVFMPPKMDSFKGTNFVDAPPAFSMGVNFEQAALQAVDELLEMLGEHEGPEFSPKPVHKDGSVFFKLQHENNLFKFSSNIDITPDNIQVAQHSPVKVEFEVQGWFLKDEDVKKYGLRLKVLKVFFGEEQKKKRRKKIVSSEEELDVPSVSSGSPSPIKKKKTMSAEDRRILKALNKN
jgi:hypothetical protein